jgi:nitrite reductase (NO-forming)
MMVIEPAEQEYKLEEELGREPDVVLHLIQHSIYASGRDAIDGAPLYSLFNGKIFRYVEEPIHVRPGDYVRIYFLNVGPNELSTFHFVGIIWDYVYWQGHPEAWMPGGQTVTAGPSDSWVIEFRVPPDEGAYTMLTHGVGQSTRGAIGLMVADRNAQSPLWIDAEGPLHTEEEMEQMREEAIRIVAPYKVGTAPVDRTVYFGRETDEVTITIIGNSFSPKVVQVTPGTTVTWINEDAFIYMAGEFSGLHNAVAITDGPERFASPLLAHGESYSITFEEEGEYDYICTPHPYMLGRLIVREERPTGRPELGARGEGGGLGGGWALALAAVAVVVSGVGFFRKR